MIPTITAFESSPDRGRGLARDMPVRWALEEVGQPYNVRLVSFAEMKQPAHLALQPFGQIPTYEEGDLALFESGAIILRIAEQHPGLLSDDRDARARAIMWMFAAKSTVEPVIVEREVVILGVGRVRTVPAFASDNGDDLRIVKKRVCNFSWCADHRVVDGATMARASEVMRRVVEEPDIMVMHLR